MSSHTHAHTHTHTHTHTRELPHMKTCLRLGRGSNLVNIYQECEHSNVVLGYPPKANSVFTRREMFLPSELGNDGPEESKDQYHRTRNDGRES